MASATDPNEVRLTGENSFIRLLPDEASPQTTRASHWRVLFSPGGSGHVLFLKSDLTDGEIRVYSDNIALTRWLQGEIESILFPEFADESLPVLDAVFSKDGNPSTFWTETVETDDEVVTLTWYDFEEPFVLRAEAGSTPGRSHGVYSCFIPARRAQIMINGMAAEGRAFPEERDGWTSSTACLAWSETWVRPRDIQYTRRAKSP